jgi:hypothetical protein
VAKPGARLLYATHTPEWAEEWGPKLAPFNIFRPGTPPRTATDELAIHFMLPDDLSDLKFAAISAHESQVEGLIHVFGRDLMQALGQENFRLGAVKEG